jgi:hypothetical protein
MDAMAAWLQAIRSRVLCSLPGMDPIRISGGGRKRRRQPEILPLLIGPCVETEGKDVAQTVGMPSFDGKKRYMIDPCSADLAYAYTDEYVEWLEKQLAMFVRISQL